MTDEEMQAFLLGREMHHNACAANGISDLFSPQETEFLKTLYGRVRAIEYAMPRPICSRSADDDPDAAKAFAEEMKGRQYGQNETQQAWEWFRVGWCTRDGEIAAAEARGMERAAKIVDHRAAQSVPVEFARSLCCAADAIRAAISEPRS